MNDLIDNVYLPDFDKRKIRDSDAYKLLKDNNKDTSVLEDKIYRRECYFNSIYC